MYEFLEGDRVKIRLKQAYTIDEIRGFGCHPDIDGKRGTIQKVEDFWTGEKSYTIKLDEVMNPHELHKNTDHDEPFDIYIETSESLELEPSSLN